MKKFIVKLVGVYCFVSTVFAQEDSVIRLNATIQSYSITQPWQKNEPVNKNGLVTMIEGGYLLTTAEMVANAVFLELETADRNHRVLAKVKAIDYRANLALLEGKDEAAREKLASLLKPISIVSKSKIGEEVGILQAQSSGKFISTPGKLQAAEMYAQLYFKVKTSMQSSASSRTLPVFKEKKLIGLMTSYSSDEQILTMIASEGILAFLSDAADGETAGLPVTGIRYSHTRDDSFREWLKLKEKMGGVYISKVEKGSPAESAGLAEGDVLLSIGDQNIDKQGYITSENYGKLHYNYVVKLGYKMGEKAPVTILRDGEEKKLEIEFKPIPDGVMPSFTSDKAPNFLIKGGLVFQELSNGYIKAYGKDWMSRTPIALLDVYYHPHEYEEGRNRVVFISDVVRTPATLGYEGVSQVIVEKVNGKPIADIKSLAEALKHSKDGIHTIEIGDDPKKLYLSEEEAAKVDEKLKQRGVPFLNRY